MIDVFTEEIEVLIKEGISNLYWYKNDLKKLWLRAGVQPEIANGIYSQRNEEGKKLSKRQLLDSLYEQIRNSEYNRKLEISRNFVRTLIEHKNFVPQDANHRIEKAQTAALKLKEIISEQEIQKEYKDKIRKKANESKKRNYESELMKLRESFVELCKIENPQSRGLALEPFFTNLMKASGIPVYEPFKITGEQIDGAIKHDGHYYLIELK